MEPERSNKTFVRRLQEALCALGFPIAVDGIWGDETDEHLDIWASDHPDVAGQSDTEQALAAVETLSDRKESQPLHFRGTPFAPELPGAARAIWPVMSSHNQAGVVSHRQRGRIIGSSGRRFGGGRRSTRKRSNGEKKVTRRFHCGVDLYAEEGDAVIAIEPGVVVNRYGFVKGKRRDGSRYLVSCVLIASRHRPLVINYAEVADSSIHFKVGDQVEAGDMIARVGKMRVSSMLHFEMYTATERRNRRWYMSRNRPRTLLDPTRYLLDLRTRAGFKDGGA